MSLDDLIKYNDARLKTASTQADIAEKAAHLPADVQMKLAQVAKARQEVIKAWLDNVAKYLDIKWDAQAHAHLIKMRKLYLRKARLAEDEAKTFRSNLVFLNRLLDGSGTVQGIPASWKALTYIRSRVTPLAAVTMGQVPIDPAAYEPESWTHPDHDADKPLTKKDPGSLLNWARKNNYLPVVGTAAWDYVAGLLQAMNDNVAAEATRLETEAEAAEKAAYELSKLDWDRLNG